MSGDPNPDATGQYLLTGGYGGQPAYRRTDGAYWIWYYLATGTWTLSATKGEIGPSGWYHATDLQGIYDPYGPATGNPIVTAH